MEYDSNYCYRHPGEVAIQNCSKCRRPVCSLCIRESGDPLLCPVCQKKASKEAREAGIRPWSALKRKLAHPRGSGTAETRIPPSPHAGDIEEPPGMMAGGDTDPSSASVDRPTKDKRRKTLGLADITVSEGNDRIDREVVYTRDTESKKEPPDVSGAEGDEIARDEKEENAGTHEGDISREELERRASERGRTSVESGAGLEVNRPVATEGYSPYRQILSALPWGTAVALWSAVFWGALGLLVHTRANVALLFTGLIVSYTLIKASTRKKDEAGRLVWTAPPPPWLTGLVGLGLTAAVLPIIEFMFYKGILRNFPTLKLGFGAYWSSEFMKTLDYFLIVAGLVLAFALPFIWEFSVTRRSS